MNEEENEIQKEIDQLKEAREKEKDEEIKKLIDRSIARKEKLNIEY